MHSELYKYQNRKVLGLVDCNNFYASCERVFNPRLANQPIVVLSSNDGCIVARSNEAKALGIPMGAPLHEYQHIIIPNKVKVFSSNYTLYGDMSARVMNIISDQIPEIEIYSIDECFLDLSSFPDPVKICKELRKKILQYTGIPVSIGIASSKTLSKAANRYAKKNQSLTAGVYYLNNDKQTEAVLEGMEVNDIWGIGRRLGAKLRTLGVFTALDFKNTSPQLIRKKFNVLLARTQLELQGISCIDTENTEEDRKSLVVSRSFGQKLSELKDLESAVSSFIARAGEKLRQESLSAGVITVFIRTNHFSKNDNQYSSSASISLTHPSSDSQQLISAAIDCLRKIYRPGFLYKKAGVLLHGIFNLTQEQQNIFIAEDPKTNRLMKTLDLINKRHGRMTLNPAISATQEKYRPNCSLKSPEYTTDWSDLPKVF